MAAGVLYPTMSGWRHGASRRPQPRGMFMGTPEIYFAKRIDNSRVVKIVDPKRRREMAILAVTLGVFFLLVHGLPVAALQRHRVRLPNRAAEGGADTIVESNRALKLEEASLKDLSRIERWRAQTGHEAAGRRTVAADGDAPLTTSAPVMAKANHIMVVSACSRGRTRTRGPHVPQRFIRRSADDGPPSARKRAETEQAGNAGKRSQDANPKALLLRCAAFPVDRRRLLPPGAAAGRQVRRLRAARATPAKPLALPVEPRRGTIYDRNGSALAMSIDVDSVFAVPSEIPDQETTAAFLGKVLDLDPQDILARIAGFAQLRLGQAQARRRDQRTGPRAEPAGHLFPQRAQALLSQARTGGPGARATSAWTTKVWAGWSASSTTICAASRAAN